MRAVAVLAALAAAALASAAPPRHAQAAFTPQGALRPAGFTPRGAPKPRRGSFTIEADAFLRDGQPMTLLAGEVHYFRIPRQLWADRLRRVQGLGFNAIQVYVPWNWHEPVPGVYNFEGGADLIAFLRLAANSGLLVLLRPGPYICAEWDFGGLPAWLADPGSVAGGGEMKLRSSDPRFMAPVLAWWGTLLPLVRPMLYDNGGPIVMVQIENEFGNVGAPDETYLRQLTSAARAHLGPDVVLYTTDAPHFVVNGTLAGDVVITTIDSGYGWLASDLNATFSPVRALNPPGKTPMWSSETYDGWITWWGSKWADSANVSIAKVASRMRGLLEYGEGDGKPRSGGVALYMAHGGTNWGFWSGGAVGENDTFSGIITSYDYAAPIAEGGGTGQPGYGGPDRWAAVAEALRAGGARPADGPLPSPPVRAYGRVALDRRVALRALLPDLADGQGIWADLLGPMESFNQSRGFIAYAARVPASALAAGADLVLGGAVHDVGRVLLDGTLVASLRRNDGPPAVRLPAWSARAGASPPATVELMIIVAGLGRANQGWLFDVKGLPSPDVHLGGVAVTGWTVHRLPFDYGKVAGLRLPVADGPPADPALLGPVVMQGVLSVPEADATAGVGGAPPDTYLAFDGPTHGVAFVNGHALGYYWPVAGPCTTLYVPGVWLTGGDNVVTLVELSSAGAGAVASVATPDFSGPKAAPPSLADRVAEDGGLVGAAPPRPPVAAMLGDGVARWPGAGGTPVGAAA